MQTVPSLVGTGSAVAAASIGLAFAQPVDSIPPKPSRNHRRTISDNDIPSNLRMSSLPVTSRPGTSSASHKPAADETQTYYNTLPHQFSLSSATGNPRHPRPLSTQFTPPKLNGRRQSFVRQGDLVAPTIAEDQRDSVSSNGSWMRRLSIRPLSQHGSIRSSVGPDSQSITFSHGSSAPILSPTNSVPAPLPPNKLVKRAPSAHQNGPVMRQRSKSHLPTLRRPATSHQRSATLQQFQQIAELGGADRVPKYSLDQQALPKSTLLQPEAEPPSQARETTRWTSFFVSRISNLSVRGASDRLIDRSPNSRSALPTKRICVPIDGRRDIYLIKGSMVDGAAPCIRNSIMEESPGVSSHDTTNGENIIPTPEDTPTKRPRRSISMHFSSPSNWISKTGSIRRPKRGAEPKGGNKRHVSAPITTSQGPAQDDLTSPKTTDYTSHGQHQATDFDPTTTIQPRARKRNSSSPLPPLSRLSSFHIDLAKVGAQNVPAQHVRPNQPSGSSQGPGAEVAFRGSQNERSSTMNSSDLEMRGFNSGDDEDTDFKSDTMFDSIRTTGSARNRAVETPLESMFDESPPSTAGNNSKTKRLSIQEILGRSWDENNRIMEEEESIPTPVRDSHDPGSRLRTEASISRFSYEQPQNEMSLASRDYSRLSLDDDFDEDWTRDDDIQLSNHLSPPSSPLNSRNVSPNLRMALAGMNSSGSRTGSPEALHSDTNSERPRSNLFDWSESTVHDKHDLEGQSPRPRTVHGKQELDVRGGRSANRKGPSVAHVRSQSVPVVHDSLDNNKSATPKYGTWGLGTKTVKEDWDDDFEFGNGEIEGKDTTKDFAMLVPASIQASQPSVKAHSGQIREFSLLVNDLKRLCRHGRDMDMLNGPQAGLWKEAEGIIALASPDEDSLEGIDGESSSVDFGSSSKSERFVDDGFDAASLNMPDDPFEIPDINFSKTTVIRKRNSGRRRSVFSPEDDIFGGSWPTADEPPAQERPRTPENNINLGGHDVTVVVRSVLEAMQQRSASDPLYGSGRKDDKLHFGTNSLKALVKRAGDLRDVLSDLIRRADQISQSPIRTPRHGASPDFTRVFTDPSSSPPKRLPHSRSNASGLSRTSMDASPSSGIGQRMQMMTVS